MRSLQILSLPLFASFALAKQCTNVTVPVNIEARQGIFDIPEFVNNYDVTTFAQNFTSIKANFTAQALRGYQTVRGSYNISAKICKPDNDNKANPTVQFLTHGIGFDKSYWDLPFNGYNYSYTDVATDSFGFYTVAIDRFGIGNSSHGRTWDESVNLIQAPAEVSAIYEITNMLRNGTFPSTSKKFQKVVHIGHSFGSAESYLLSALHPEASDGIVLTGFSMNATWLPVTTADWNLHIARLNQPLRFGNITLAAAQNMWNYMKSYGNPDLLKLAQQFLGYAGIQVSTNDIWNDIATTEVGDIINQWNATVPPVPQNLPTGYTTWSDYTSNQFAFLYPGSFDIAIGIFAEMTKQPVTVGEIFTLASGAPPMSAFTGPVQVVTGREDAIYCGGDCMNTAGTPLASIPAGVQKAFPNAKAFQAYIQPNSGHGINLHYNSTGAYRVINNWLVSQGLGSS